MKGLYYLRILLMSSLQLNSLVVKKKKTSRRENDAVGPLKEGKFAFYMI